MTDSTVLRQVEEDAAKRLRELAKKAPEPMSLMLAKQHEALDGAHALPEKYRKPLFEANAVDNAAGVYSRWDNSDPFARARMAHYLRQGYDKPSEVLKEFHPKLQARLFENQKRGEAAMRALTEKAA